MTETQPNTVRLIDWLINFIGTHANVIDFGQKLELPSECDRNSFESSFSISAMERNIYRRISISFLFCFCHAYCTFHVLILVLIYSVFSQIDFIRQTNTFEIYRTIRKISPNKYTTSAHIHADRCWSSIRQEWLHIILWNSPEIPSSTLIHIERIIETDSMVQLLRMAR